MPPVLAQIGTDELLASFVSRIARANGISGLEGLLLDLTVSPSDFHSGKVNAIRRVAEVATPDPTQPRRRRLLSVHHDRPPPGHLPNLRPLYGLALYPPR